MKTLNAFLKEVVARQPFDENKDIDEKVYDDGDFSVWFHGNGKFAITENPEDDWYIDKFTAPARTVQQAKKAAAKYMKKWRS